MDPVGGRSEVERWDLQQVLGLVLDGQTENEIADSLGLRRQSVHAGLKQLHKRFNVHSRAELLFKCRLWNGCRKP